MAVSDTGFQPYYLVSYIDEGGHIIVLEATQSLPRAQAVAADAAEDLNRDINVEQYLRLTIRPAG